MNISKIHKRYSELLNNPRVLTNPEEFLGPNYKAVLNFWMILDDLSEDQWETIDDRLNEYLYYNLIGVMSMTGPTGKIFKISNPALMPVEEFKDNLSQIKIVELELFKSICEVVIMMMAGSNSDRVYTLTRATTELIGMHLLLDQQKPLTFFEMFLNL